MKFSAPNLRQWLDLINAKSYCPVCETKNVAFHPLPDFYCVNAERYGYTYFGKGEMTALETYSCEKCGASDRERLYAYWLANSFTNHNDSRTCKAIHFAPDNALSMFLRKSSFFDEYQTADLLMTEVDYKVDIMNLPFPAESYDFFLCSHVLEHLADDYAAIRELFRIIKKGGKGLLMAPIVVGLPETLEDPSITDESERWRLFGQNDHVRLYSHDDYVKRIESCGFDLQQLDKSYFGRWLFNKLGLKSTSVLYVVSKP